MHLNDRPLPSSPVMIIITRMQEIGADDNVLRDIAYDVSLTVWASTLIICTPRARPVYITIWAWISRFRASIHHQPISSATWVNVKLPQLRKHSFFYRKNVNLVLVQVNASVLVCMKKEWVPLALVSALVCSARRVSISRAIVIRFFSMALFCSTSSLFPFFSYSYTLLNTTYM